MPCTSPWDREVPGTQRSTVKTACGRCMSCRLERSRQWAIRIMHETRSHDHNHFCLLSYDDKHVPTDGSLSVRDLQKGLKRIRKRFDQRFRYFAAGEYGSRTGRPHYHVIFFGLELDDLQFHKKSPTGNALFVSDKLDAAWQLGFCNVGTVTYQSAQYVAKYVIDKIDGAPAEQHYQGKRPEFAVMSRRQGIGSAWIDRYREDIFPSGTVVVDGREQAAPAYYLKRVLTMEQREQLKENFVLFAPERRFPNNLEAKALHTKARLRK